VSGGVATRNFAWALGSLCALHRVPFDADLLLKAYPPPYTADTLVRAGRALGFKVKRRRVASKDLPRMPLPCLLETFPCTDTAPVNAGEDGARLQLVLLVNAREDVATLFYPGSNTPAKVALADLTTRSREVYLFARSAPKAPDADVSSGNEQFGFRWFIPELLKHRAVWRDVLIGSLVIQLLALGVPLFTQTIIDKVVVHRTESTLIAIAIGLAVFMLFSAALTWVRQYLVLHTGNRVDAVLGAAVFEHLFKLPPRYFEHRPTGVIAARLHGVENIREFVASAAMTLILDLPFSIIFVAVMLYYSVVLTLIALALLAVIVVLTAALAPMFQARLNEQFLLGARNQAFVTEYVSGLETVKSLQLEPQIRERYHDYLASYLHAGFSTRQVMNTYNVVSNALEQLMTMTILIAGAYFVMSGDAFTIGMLVAFQMFAARLSQPMLRLVGLWQQFQQASLSVKRLGDVMNAPAEPYTVTPARLATTRGAIHIDDLGFRYNEQLPFLYRNFSLVVEPGAMVAIMGPSGCGKSTLAKLLQVFYQPTEGGIRIDGIDIRHLSANEVRSYFGVVPQETVLFSGSIYDNLAMANPQASFEQIVQACRMAEVHEVIDHLPNGYRTEIGERGIGLSGGQKQRLAIARALIKRPKILIFDEATSNLDVQTSEHFAMTINALKGKVTMLYIAHQLPKALQVDEVVQIGEKIKLSVVAGEKGE
jgi:ATP-binding cassette, subfamily B, bacterial HlyB/CyaB